MDEPLSNLDALLRMEMRAELKRLLKQLELTTIYVTHDQVEALSMGDRVAVMNEGRIVQVDSLVGKPLVMGIRAENIEVVPEAGPGLVPAKVLVLEPLGAHNLLTVQSGDDTLRVTTRADLFPAPDSEIWLRIEPTRVRWMDRETRTALD